MREYQKGLLSVCCVSYRHAEYIPASLEAIWNSGYEHLEIIALDDGSPDDSARVLAEMEKKSPVPMTLILQENTGNIALNFNRAMARATGEYVSIIALDDVLYADAIERMMKVMLSDEKMAFTVASRITTIDGQGQVTEGRYGPMRLDSLEKVTPEALLELEYQDFHSFFLQGSVWRRELIDAVGGFDEDMIGDDIVLRTKLFRYLKEHPEYCFEIQKHPLVYYRLHTSNVSSNGPRQIRSVTEYLERYWPESPNPAILLDWSLHYLRQLPREQWGAFLSMNRRTSLLLQDDRVMNLLRLPEYEETIFIKVGGLLELGKRKHAISREKEVYVKLCGLHMCLYHKKTRHSH